VILASRSLAPSIDWLSVLGVVRWVAAAAALRGRRPSGAPLRM